MFNFEIVKVNEQKKFFKIHICRYCIRNSKTHDNEIKRIE